MGTSSIAHIRSSLDKLVGIRDNLKQRLQSNETDILRLEQDEKHLDLTVELFRQMIDQEVTVGVQAVERLLTEGLQAVFNDQDIRVKAQVDVSRGKVSVDLLTSQVYADGTEIEGLSNDAFGGAVSTVQSVLLRLIIILRRGLYPLLLLDESLPAFDDVYVSNMASFLSTLCKKLNVDILLVSHNPNLVEAADRSYRIVKKDDSAVFELLRS